MVNKFFFIIIVLLLFLVSCAQTKDHGKEVAPVDKINSESSYAEKIENAGEAPETTVLPKTKGLGSLCNGEQECISFCLNNRGKCEAYCQKYNNVVCAILSSSSNKSLTKSSTPSSPILGGLCPNVDACGKYCSSHSFACEVYCLQNPQNNFCQERFSYVYEGNVQDSLLRFPQFRNRKYMFNNGKLLEEPPHIEHLGVEFAPYNPTTRKAGDFVFDKFTYSWGETYNTKIFYDYGEEGEENGNINRDPQTIYILPLGTKVRAVSSGIVTSIHLLYSGDLTVFVTKPESPSWHYEHEHVINPMVKEGDMVVAGQVLAEVSNYSKWLREDGYGVVDIGLFKPSERPGHHCPFLYLDESIREKSFTKIRDIYKSWEEYMGDTSLYDEEHHALPGCIVTEPID